MPPEDEENAVLSDEGEDEVDADESEEELEALTTDKAATTKR